MTTFNGYISIKLGTNLIYSSGSEFIHNTVPYRFPLEFLSRSRSLYARRTVFLA